MEAKQRKRVRIGDLLIQKNLITEPQLMQALAHQKETGKKLGQALISLDILTEEIFLSALAEHFDYPLIDLSAFRLNSEIVSLLPEIQARRFKAVVLAEEGDGLLVGMIDPTDIMLVDDLTTILKKPVHPAFMKEADVYDSIDAGYRKTDEMASIAGELEGELEESDFDLVEIAESSTTSDAPVVRLLQSLFEDAVSVKASDIHIEPEESLLRIRLRVDGDLQEQVMNEKRVASALVSRLKIMSGLDISEKRIPQDGRFKIKVKGRNIDVRLSTMPVPFGETMVMRLLDQSNALLDMAALGMPGSIKERFEHHISRPNGIVLVTGPTGSGKTTTLYSALNLLNTPEKKIITAEDPIEYSLPRINQVQVNAKIGLNFATVLRASLRQDPDVILIGEMRDSETSEIALRAAMTGHMVLSTLHTNDAIATAMRLLDMGIDSFLIASALRGVLAQRLIKVLCKDCKQEHQLTDKDRGFIQHIDPQAAIAGSYFTSKGCHRCNNTGYRGRIGIYEFLEMDEAILSALRKADFDAFNQAARNNPYYRPLAACALDHAKEGLTSLGEVYRITASLQM